MWQGSAGIRARPGAGARRRLPWIFDPVSGFSLARVTGRANNFERAAVYNEYHGTPIESL